MSPVDEDERAAGVDPDERLGRLERARRRPASQRPALIPTKMPIPPSSGVGVVVPAVGGRKRDEPPGERGAQKQPRSRPRRPEERRRAATAVLTGA